MSRAGRSNQGWRRQEEQRWHTGAVPPPFLSVTTQAEPNQQLLCTNASVCLMRGGGGGAQTMRVYACVSFFLGDGACSPHGSFLCPSVQCMSQTHGFETMQHTLAPFSGAACHPCVDVDHAHGL